MQHWIDINLVTLQKLAETLPQRILVLIQAKLGPINSDLFSSLLTLLGTTGLIFVL